MWNPHPDERPAYSPSTGTLGAIALAGLALYVWLVGGGRVLAALGRVPLWNAGVLLLVAFVPLVLWGISLELVLACLGVDRRVHEAVALFLASVFLNSVTPFGQVGGDPPSGLLVARADDATFESGLAAIGSVNVLNRIGAVVLGVVGVAWLTTRQALPGTFRTPAVGATVVSFVAVVVLVWLGRERLVRVGDDVVVGVVARLSPCLSFADPPPRDVVEHRIRRFVVALERLRERPAHVAAASFLGVAGQGLVAGTLWFALAALGVDVALPVVLVVVPVAKLSGLSPSPGGTGSAEVVLSGLLATVTGVSVPLATAAALLYRAAAFWMPTLVGGVVAVWVLERSGD
jgi:hypothetical protein